VKPEASMVAAQGRTKSGCASSNGRSSDAPGLFMVKTPQPRHVQLAAITINTLLKQLLVSELAMDHKVDTLNA